jgi:PBP1b-binding outer membrane lipoprotein LpoB
MLRKLKTVGTLIIAMLLMSGCVTVRESQLPSILQQLNNHDFNEAERYTIGNILDYINELENE